MANIVFAVVTIEYDAANIITVVANIVSAVVNIVHEIDVSV